ncbi:MAG: gas vesicle protein GvpJ [Sphingomonadales bacterium]
MAPYEGMAEDILAKRQDRKELIRTNADETAQLCTDFAALDPERAEEMRRLLAEFSTSDLIGGEHGYRLRKVVDNFIHSVLKTEENMQKRWIDNRLTVACKYGLTLIYDEFTRSRPEANNVLLSVLQEKVLGLPAAREGDAGYLKVHPQFTAIFTSNPEEYAGVFRSQDALRDRTLVDLVNRILDKGLVINGDIMVSVAGVELLGIKLRMALASFETAARYGLEFPTGTDLSVPAWEDTCKIKEFCPDCRKVSIREELLDHGCPWCGWTAPGISV